MMSDDAGRTWQPRGLSGHDVRAITASVVQRDLLVAGTRPLGLFSSSDGGRTWLDLPGFRRLARRRAFFSPAEWPPIPYVSAIAASTVDPLRVVVGIEVGGVLLTSDGGQTWRVGRGAIYDCHSLAAHSRDGLRFYQGGAGFGKCTRTSSDGGETWTGPRSADGLTYGWATAGALDASNTWYYSASSSAFKAHTPGRAAARIYRVREGSSVEHLTGILPDGIPEMPYQLAAASGSLFAGLANGDVWCSENRGDSWNKLPLTLGGIHRSMIVV
jgi:hypothetical protein